MKVEFPSPLEIDPSWLANTDIDQDIDRYCLKFSKQEIRAIKPRRQIPASDWAEKYRMLPTDAAIPGRWKNQTTPYLVGVMDASFFKSVQKINICAVPQVGKSDGVNNCLGYAADRRPGNALVVYPDEITARDNSKDRLGPMFKDSPRLRKYLTGYVDDTSALKINLQHMRLYMAWANSASRLGNRPLPYVVLDEVDKYPVTANKKEASPIALAEKRTRTFSHMRKIWMMSTPTTEDGPIWVALTQESQIVFDYYVKCPSCGSWLLMEFKQIKWPDDTRDPLKVESQRLAWYECQKCQGKWDDADRDKAVRLGRWRDRETGLTLMSALKSVKPISIGFHIPSWISPFVSMSEAAAAFLSSKDDKTKLKDFKNAHCAEPWVVHEKKRSEDRILELVDDRPRGVVPGDNQIACLTAGVDTQDDGFYYEIRAWGWGLEKSSWGVREGFVTTFGALDQILWQDEYKDAAGNNYFVRLVCQDAMGHNTAEVYDFCRTRRGKILPTQGKQTMAQPFNYSNIEFYPGKLKNIPIPGGLKLLRLNTQYFKNQLSNLLEISPGDPGAYMYHSELTDDWASQMTSEYVDEKGIWQLFRGRPNHGWDCSVLSLVAYEVLGVKHWKKKEKTEENQPSAKKTPPKKSNWITGRKGWMNVG